MSRKWPTSIVFEVSTVTRQTVELEALDIHNEPIPMGSTSQPATIVLPATGMLADVRPGDRFRLVRDDPADQA